MAKNIQISIDEPCHENWDEMSKTEKGRFCASCQKQVLDFSGMSDSQVAAFFKKSSVGSVCGRFFPDQLERNIEIPQRTIPWIKYFFRFALPALLVSAKTSAQGKAINVNDTPSNQVARALNGKIAGPVVTNKVIESKPFVKSTPQLLINETGIIKGKVVDEQGSPVYSATVIIKGTNIGVVVNNAGEFSITPPAASESLVLVASSVGYITSDVKVVNRGKDVNIVVRIDLQSALMGEIICTRPSKKKKPKAIPVLTQKLMDTAFRYFKVFPNPVSSGASLHIEWKKIEEGYYKIELIDASGKNVHSREVWIDAEAQVMNMEIPSVTPGIYYLSVINKESGKRSTEILAIQ